MAWQHWLEIHGFHDVDATRGPRFNHADLGLDAAIDGGGIVLGRLSLAMRDIKSKRLVAPFDSYLRPRAGFYFVAPEAALELPRVQIFRQWLMNEVDQESRDTKAFLADKNAR